MLDRIRVNWLVSAKIAPNRKDGLSKVFKLFLGDVIHKEKREGDNTVVIKAIEFILSKTDSLSDEFILKNSLEEKQKVLKGFKYRFHIDDDIALLCEVFKEIRL